jgi:hypothetical protein
VFFLEKIYKNICKWCFLLLIFAPALRNKTQSLRFLKSVFEALKGFFLLVFDKENQMKINFVFLILFSTFAAAKTTGVCIVFFTLIYRN